MDARRVEMTDAGRARVMDRDEQEGTKRMDGNEPFDLSATEGKNKGAKSRKRAGAKAPAENTKRSLNLRIDDDSYRRLNIHALMRDTTVSELVMEYARNLREYSMPHRIGGKPEQGAS